jgi:hypothetical protein
MQTCSKRQHQVPASFLCEIGKRFKVAYAGASGLLGEHMRVVFQCQAYCFWRNPCFKSNQHQLRPGGFQHFRRVAERADLPGRQRLGRTFEYAACHIRDRDVTDSFGAQSVKIDLQVRPCGIADKTGGGPVLNEGQGGRARD